MISQGTYMSPYICLTNLLACRLILELQHAFYQPVGSDRQEKDYPKTAKTEGVSDDYQETIELRASG